MAKLFAYDTETNSVDTENGFIQEIAWAVYDTDTWRCLTAKSFLIDWPDSFSYEVDPAALAVTGLTREYCRSFGERPSRVFCEFLDDASSCEFLCGHNAIQFDRPMILTNSKRVFFGVPLTFDKMIHIDTLLDCEYPAHMKVQALKYLAYDHGYILANAHEALADVMACVHILKQYDFARVVEIAKTPIVKVSARVAWEDTEGRDRIKKAKFFWNPTLKRWEKSMREFFLPGVQLQLGTNAELGIEK